MTALRIETPRVFVPLCRPSRYKGAYGGRGSAKSWHFASAGVELAVSRPGVRGVCIREVQKDLKDSAKFLIESTIARLGVGSYFNPQAHEIKTHGGGVIIFQGMQDHTAESIKSLEGFDWAWIEEAHTLSARSLEMLRPSIRKPGSELWFSWNPRSKSDPVDKLFRGGTPPPDCVSVRSNYSDNPFFPAELEKERKHDFEHNPERYAHIWLGAYEPEALGAIWTRQVIEETRISAAPKLERIVIGVDPAVTNTEVSDTHGIMVCALGADENGYILEDASIKGTPHDWARRALAMYDHYDADAIVIEVNQGGDMVRHTLESTGRKVRIIEVRATRGKHVRAEPISALYSTGRVHHVGTFPELEQQMVQFTANGYQGKDSADRVDAMVWALTELFPRIVTVPTKEPEYYPVRGDGSWMG